MKIIQPFDASPGRARRSARAVPVFGHPTRRGEDTAPYRPSRLRLVAGLAVLAGCLAAGLAATHAAPPVITSQPQPQTGFIGANVNLRVAAMPSSGLRYRWRFNGTNLPNTFPGQLTPLLMITNATLASGGPYSVVVSNSFGAVTSQTAVVSINDPIGSAVGFINLSAVPGHSLFNTFLAHVGADQTVAHQINFTHDGASLFKVDGNGFLANNFLDGWSAPDMLLTVGEGWFFRNPSASPFTVTIVGGAVEGSLTNILPAGYSLIASLVPQEGAISSVLGFPATPGVKVFRLDRDSQTFQIHTVAGFDWQPDQPSMAVGEAFFVREPAPVEWVRDFFVGFFPAAPFGVRIVQPALASETAEINYFTHHSDPAFGRVFDLDGVTPVTNDFVGQLYAATINTEAALIPIGRPIPFLNGAGGGYIRSSTIQLPGLPGGQTIFLQLRAWEKCAGDTYEQAVANGAAAGRSTVFSAVARATIEDGLPGLPPPNTSGFPAFQVSLGPEVPLRVARIQSVGATVEICFATRPGAIYCLQTAGTTSQPMDWAVLPGFEQIIGTGHVAAISDTAGDQQRFYRVCRVR